MRAVAGDIGVDAVKVGMLGIARDDRTRSPRRSICVGEVPVVVDPVMVSESGAELLEADARDALIDEILPRASVLTPNLPEARRLAGLGDGASAAELAAAIRALGPAAVIVTGGHADGVDVLDDGSGEPLQIPGEMHPDGAAHGSGCTHSSALAACSRSALPLREAAARARELAGRAVRDGLRGVGAGPGPGRRARGRRTRVAAR